MNIRVAVVELWKFGTAIEDSQYHPVDTPIQKDFSCHIAHSVLGYAPLPSRLMDLVDTRQHEVGERKLPPCHCGT